MRGLAVEGVSWPVFADGRRTSTVELSHGATDFGYVRTFAHILLRHRVWSWLGLNF